MPERVMVAPDEEVVAAVAGFARLLRDAGVDAGPDRVVTAVRAAAEVGPLDAAVFRAALRAALVGRRDDLPLFEAAFDLYWAPRAADGRAGASTRRRGLPLAPERAREWSERLGLPAPGPGVDRREAATSAGYSAREALRRKDFSELSHAEAEQVRALMRDSAWRVAERRTRRLAPAPAGAVDLRRTARRGIRSGGELVTLLHRRPRLRRRPLVMLCDVSGSMESYSRFVLLFAHAIGRREDLETFVFATRLTRITRLIRRRDLDAALEAVGGAVQDFSGGTRIGQAIHEFNRLWSRRVLGHGAVVILVSDGWDRGDPALLSAELARLHRSCHRLVWLNPLLGSNGYQPLTRGMTAALPHCDDFIAAHSLGALDDLGRLLRDLGRRPFSRVRHA
ncbi:MAG: vWA domain-containing protein [Candidatus Dormibacteraceae bacterium]